MFAAVHLVDFHLRSASASHVVLTPLLALTDALPTVVGGVLIVLAVIVLFSLVKAYTDTVSRRISSHRVRLNPEEEERQPEGAGLVVFLLAVLVIAAWVIDGLQH